VRDLGQSGVDRVSSDSVEMPAPFERGRRGLLVLSTVVAQAYVASLVSQVSMPVVAHAAVKLVPALLLSFVALSGSDDMVADGGVFTTRIGIGLGISALSDSVQSPGYVHVGAAIGLLARLAYSASFHVDTAAGQRHRLGSNRLWMGRFFVAFWACLVLAIYGWLSPYLDESARIPVAAYSGVVGVMMYRALARHEPVCGTESYIYSACGAALLTLSDIVLATTFFQVFRSENSEAVHLLLYYGGQICLAMSTIFDVKQVLADSKAVPKAQPPPIAAQSPKVHNNPVSFKKGGKKKKRL